jgi:hypothetical protein
MSEREWGFYLDDMIKFCEKPDASAKVLFTDKLLIASCFSGIVVQLLMPQMIRNYISRLNQNNILVEKVFLLGSYIKGTPRDNSDIDIAVISTAFEGNRYFDR